VEAGVSKGLRLGTLQGAGNSALLLCAVMQRFPHYRVLMEGLCFVGKGKCMNSPYLELPAFDPETGNLNVIIETPKGVRNKYKFEPEKGLFELDKALPLGMMFPFDFGFVPSTKGEDGDPLDALVLLEESVFCGCLVPTRLIGVIEAQQIQKGKSFRNDRLIGVFEKQQLYAGVKDLKDLDDDLLEKLEHFFISYNEAQGRKFKPLRRSGAQAAKKLVEAQMNK
jgi:inorganic pyrophosphatase